MYPIKFETIFKDKLWGGNKIKTVLGKDYGKLLNCGETWELSGVNGDISVVKNGGLKGRDLKNVIKEHGDELLGRKIHKKFGESFPLLIKFIDANQDLSIQVHPNDKLAKERHKSFGKTEMWYVLQADKGATLVSGFNKTISREQYLEKFNAGELLDILNVENVEANDVYFLPAGRVHTIGKGLMIAEIQQTSDITYRIYDFDRLDDKGNKRELHVEAALDAIDYNYHKEYKTRYTSILNQRINLVSSKYFTTNKFEITEPVKILLPDLDCFKIYICIEGSGSLKYTSGQESFKKGEVLLVPATIKNYTIEPLANTTLLESYIEDDDK